MKDYMNISSFKTIIMRYMRSFPEVTKYTNIRLLDFRLVDGMDRLSVNYRNCTLRNTCKLADEFPLYSTVIILFNFTIEINFYLARIVTN